MTIANDEKPVYHSRWSAYHAAAARRARRRAMRIMERAGVMRRLLSLDKNLKAEKTLQAGTVLAIVAGTSLFSLGAADLGATMNAANHTLQQLNGFMSPDQASAFMSSVHDLAKLGGQGHSVAGIFQNAAHQLLHYIGVVSEKPSGYAQQVLSKAAGNIPDKLHLLRNLAEKTKNSASTLDAGGTLLFGSTVLATAYAGMAGLRKSLDNYVKNVPQKISKAEHYAKYHDQSIPFYEEKAKEKNRSNKSDGLSL